MLAFFISIFMSINLITVLGLLTNLVKGLVYIAKKISDFKYFRRVKKEYKKGTDVVEEGNIDEINKILK